MHIVFFRLLLLLDFFFLGWSASTVAFVLSFNLQCAFCMRVCIILHQMFTQCPPFLYAAMRLSSSSQTHLSFSPCVWFPSRSIATIVTALHSTALYSVALRCTAITIITHKWCVPTIRNIHLTRSFFYHHHHFFHLFAHTCGFFFITTLLLFLNRWGPQLLVFWFIMLLLMLLLTLFFPTRFFFLEIFARVLCLNSFFGPYLRLLTCHDAFLLPFNSSRMWAAIFLFFNFSFSFLKDACECVVRLLCRSQAAGFFVSGSVSLKRIIRNHFVHIAIIYGFFLHLISVYYSRTRLVSFAVNNFNVLIFGVFISVSFCSFCWSIFIWFSPVLFAFLRTFFQFVIVVVMMWIVWKTHTFNCCGCFAHT